jgi:hypothetical protein
LHLPRQCLSDQRVGAFIGVISTGLGTKTVDNFAPRDISMQRCARRSVIGRFLFSMFRCKTLTNLTNVDFARFV